ncbi:hypothetical protein [Bradyrhizobium sp. UFLA03-84]|uniref:helix-turn-helix transcriptional regulator n=1 Tax=Bradyrhizobium sp. UFLA03-84 TaxID=418599 RepID=UPI0018E9B076|nr:hypothetical protein [Bradyrhizobium sp. UFLA03-84]
MTKQVALPPTLAPRLIGRDAAAAYVCVSPTLFDQLVQNGTMPAAKRLTDNRSAWDVRELDIAVDHLPRKGGVVSFPDDFGWTDAPPVAAQR